MSFRMTNEQSVPVAGNVRNRNGDGPAVEDVVSVFPFEYLLREDAVAVFRSGTQVVQPHGVQCLVRLFAARDGFVMAGMFGGVETASVVLGCLDP